jgi:hypothetical protein
MDPGAARTCISMLHWSFPSRLPRVAPSDNPVPMTGASPRTRGHPVLSPELSVGGFSSRDSPTEIPFPGSTVFVWHFTTAQGLSLSAAVPHEPQGALPGSTNPDCDLTELSGTVPPRSDLRYRKERRSATTPGRNTS